MDRHITECNFLDHTVQEDVYSKARRQLYIYNYIHTHTVFSKLRDTAAGFLLNPFYNAGMYNRSVFVCPTSLPNSDISIHLPPLPPYGCPVLLPIPCGSRGTASHSVLPHPPGFRDWSMEKAAYTKLGQSGIFLIHYIKTVGKNSIFPMGLLSLEAVSSNCFWPHLPPATLRKPTDRVREQEI